MKYGNDNCVYIFDFRHMEYDIIKDFDHTYCKFNNNNNNNNLSTV